MSLKNPCKVLEICLSVVVRTMFQFRSLSLLKVPVIIVMFIGLEKMFYLWGVFKIEVLIICKQLRWLNTVLAVCDYMSFAKL